MTRLDEIILNELESLDLDGHSQVIQDIRQRISEQIGVPEENLDNVPEIVNDTSLIGNAIINQNASNAQPNPPALSTFIMILREKLSVNLAAPVQIHTADFEAEVNSTTIIVSWHTLLGDQAGFRQRDQIYIHNTGILDDSEKIVDAATISARVMADRLLGRISVRPTNNLAPIHISDRIWSSASTSEMEAEGSEPDEETPSEGTTDEEVENTSLEEALTGFRRPTSGLAELSALTELAAPWIHGKDSPFIPFKYPPNSHSRPLKLNGKIKTKDGKIIYEEN